MRWCLALGLAACFAGSAQDLDQARTLARQLVDDGRVAAAREMMGDASFVGQAVLDQARRQAAEGQSEAALASYEAWFDCYPFTMERWPSRSHGDPFVTIVEAYLALRAASGRPTSPDERVSAEALTWHRSFFPAAQQPVRPHKPPTMEQLAAFGADYPRSLLVADALAQRAERLIYDAGRSGAPQVLAFYETQLAQLGEAGMSARGQIRILVGIIAGTANGGGYSDETVQARWVRWYLTIRDISGSDQERRLALLRAAEAAARASSDPSQARQLYRDYLRRYPGGQDAAQARAGLIQTYQGAPEVEEVVSALREVEALLPTGSDMTNLTCLAASVLQAAGKLDRAIGLYREALRRSPQGPAAERALAGMASVYREQGDEARMVETWEAMLQLPAREFNGEIVPGPNTHTDAYQFLAEHYMTKERWEEALALWQTWSPQSFCGNCNDAMAARRISNMATCLERLHRPDEAVDQFLEYVGGPNHLETSREMARRLVDLAAQQGRLPEVTARLQAVIEADTKARAARIKEREAAMASKPAGRASQPTMADFDFAMVSFLVQHPTAQLALIYAELHEALATGDPDALWAAIVGPPPADGLGQVDTRSDEILRLLDELGDAVRPSALEHARSDSDLRWWAWELLIRRHDDALIPILEARLDGPDHDPSRREPVRRVLGRLRTEASIAALNRSYATERREQEDARHSRRR